MGAAAVLSFQPISHFASSFPFNKQHKLRNPVLSLTEIADKPRPFGSLKPTVSSTASDGNTNGSRPRKSSTSASGRKKSDESKKSSNGIKAPNSTSQEEIIALFRRIQSSISKGETGRANKTNSFSSSKDKSTAESILDVLRESRKNVQDTRPKKGARALRWRSGVRKKRQGVDEKADAATQDFILSRPPSNFVKRSPIAYPTTPRVNLSRPPSNFVKRSPIPYPTAPRINNLRQYNEVALTTEMSELANIDKLKLSELKELAKARGIKGYSRLRKSELIQLLRS